ncbi:MAG: methyl-accepting chemotaxis sensory transducer [Firmicutes bacterium]|nr:methyl-accepting chemotaxis sensory transducer [Bacillota bacterium]
MPKISLRTKTIAFFVIVVLISSIGSGIVISKINKLYNAISTVQAESLPTLESGNKLAFNTAMIIANTRGYLLNGDQSILDGYKRYDKESDEIETSLTQTAVSAEEQQLLSQIHEQGQKYNEIAENKLFPLKRAGKTPEALQIMKSELVPVGTAYSNSIKEYSTLSNNKINAILTQTKEFSKQAQLYSIIISIITMIVGILIGFLSARSITKPIKSLVNTAQEIANGNLDQNIKVARNDEIGDLEQAFKTMVENLRKVIIGVQKSSEQVAASSEQMTASAEQSAQAATQVATAIVEVAQGADNQKKAVDDSLLVVEQMTSEIKQVASDSNNVAQVTANTVNAAQIGQEAIQQAVEQMSKVGVGTDSVQNAISKLSQNSTEVGEIVNVISGIAAQTNLLALNAAIEAARAGEAGRGFAVVAEEVRKLAEQSQEAANKITILINGNQQNIADTVGVMTTSTADVKAGIEIVNQAGTSFQEIYEKVNAVSTQINKMSATIQNLANGNQQIIHAVNQIDAESKHAAAQTQTVSATTEEQSASAEEIAASSQGLATLADELRKIIGKFKV